jgi:SAM-dependent methyltransferase
MDWTSGYASDIEYTAGFYREQSPGFLNFACVLNGYEPIPIDQPFTYFELGFGRGLTANLLAAANPIGEFYAADFNPAHVAGARQLANAAQLENLTLLENSFAELAEGQVNDLPQFDFITLHGIYTWVTAENRQHIVRFISRYLKPGGIVYVSYNAMPGWSAALPLQRLLMEHAELFPNRTDLQMKGAADFVNQVEQVQAGYFNANTGLKTRLAMLKTGNVNYLVHEYMHKHWQPMYFADVARDLADAKLDYVGSAELHRAYPALFLSSEQINLLNATPDATFRETLKDYFLNTGFRKDIFVRGARRMTGLRQKECLHQVGLISLLPRSANQLEMKLGNANINGRPEIYNLVFDALSDGPKTLGELAVIPALQSRNIAEITAILTSSGQTAFYFPANANTDLKPAQRLNQVIAKQVRYHDEYQALASPLLGNGINANYTERLMYWILSQQSQTIGVDQLAEQAWKEMKASGRKMNRDGKPLESDADNLAHLTSTAKHILNHSITLWQNLKM